jgi:6-phosphogluconolactonase
MSAYVSAHRGLIRGVTGVRICLVFACAGLIFACARLIFTFACPMFTSTSLAASQEYFVYIGTYTQSRGKGIYAFRFAPATGKLTRPVLAAQTSSPSFLAVHPNGRFLYAANEHEGKDIPGQNNTVSAYAIDSKTGSLKFLNKVSSQGEGPAHIVIDHQGKALLALNYRSGTVGLLPILPDGRLGEATAVDQHHGSGVDPKRQAGPHAHGGVFSPDNRFALVAEHGIDEVMVYRFDANKGSLIPNDPPFLKATPGAAPRHLAFHPNGKIVYALNEIGSTVTVLAYGADKGTIRRIQEITTLPAGFSGSNSTAQLQVDQAGKFLYASNRGDDSIAVFAIDPASDMLTLVEHVSTQGKTPRDFSLDPTGAFLFAANQSSDNIVLFRVGPAGRLTSSGEVVEVPEPACVVFVPAQ